MAAPKTTIWPLDPHTAAKHAILGRYLDAWLPILSLRGFPDIAYIDAFAGPGTYSKGEEGSPIIALKAMMNHRTPIRAKCHFHFVELDPERARALGQAIAQLFDEGGKPDNIRVSIHCEAFETAYPKIRAELSSAQSPPTFAFIDAFGWTGFPFSIVRDLLQRASSEVLVNFMFEEINRFLVHPDQTSNFDRLFGSADWRSIVQLQGRARSQALHDLYDRQLRRAAGAKYVRSFEMRNFRNVTDYFLFFATNNFTGLKKMKASMWKVDDMGGFSFSDATNPDQVVLFDEPNFELLRRDIVRKFSGRTVRVEDLEEYVVAETAFRETHYRALLAELEAEQPPKVTVVRAKPTRRRGQFPASTVLQFAPS